MLLLFLRQLKGLNFESGNTSRSLSVNLVQGSQGLQHLSGGATEAKAQSTQQVDLYEIIDVEGPVGAANPIRQRRLSYRLASQTFVAPANLGGGSTEVKVAFGDASGPHLFYSFLPVQNIGWPFAVHAHMELTASRQHVRKDSAWKYSCKSTDCKIIASLAP